MMDKRWYIAGAVIVLVLGGIWLATRKPAPSATVPVATSTAGNVAPGTTFYRNAGNHFQFEYGPEFRLYEDGQAVQALSYIPPCEPEGMIACVYYPKDSFGNTNFGGAGFGARLVADAKDEAACKNIPSQGAPTSASGTVNVNGTQYYSARTGGAAMNKHNEDTVFRIFRDGKCLEFTERISESNFEVYAPGTIERFTDAEKQRVTEALAGVMGSLRFTE